MKNSDIRKQSKPLKTGETIKEGDLFWSMSDHDTIQWLEVCEEYVGKEYDAALYAPMRRPITQSMEFICSSENQQSTCQNTLSTPPTTEIRLQR